MSPRRSPAVEVQTLLAQAFGVMAAARAQIRQPLDSRAQVSISIVDTRGQILGLVRGPDAPIFGIDVSLQKARTAAFFSGRHAGDEIARRPERGRAPFRERGARLPWRPERADRQDRLCGPFRRQSLAPLFSGRRDRSPAWPFLAPHRPVQSFLDRAAVGADPDQSRPASCLCNGASATDTPQRCTFIPDVASGQGAAAERHPDLPGIGSYLSRAASWSAPSASRATASTRTT